MTTTIPGLDIRRGDSWNSEEGRRRRSLDNCIEEGHGEDDDEDGTTAGGGDGGAASDNARPSMPVPSGTAGRSFFVNVPRQNTQWPPFDSTLSLRVSRWSYVIARRGRRNKHDVVSLVEKSICV
jgi:hypothetical protein